MKDIAKYSNPIVAQQQVHKYLGKGVKLYPSSRKNKKYMVQDPTGKWVHFGLYGATDYTLHRDEVRRERFRTRNSKWANALMWSPAFLSYWILW